MSNDNFTNPTVAPLADAVRRGDAPEIRRQLERVAADTPGSDGTTLLSEAIRHDRVASVEALLEGGADPNRVDARGDTAMHAAAFSSDPAVLRAMLSHGGNPDARNTHSGETALMKSLLSPNARQYEVLLEEGADPNLADTNADTPLHVAGRTNAGDAILRLLGKGAFPLAKDALGSTFQDYYFGYRRAVINDRAKQQRRSVVAWLMAHHVPLAASVEPEDQAAP